MKQTLRIAAIALTAFAAITAAKADTNSTNSVASGKDVKNPVVAAPAATPTFQFNVSENYDSRYMFRGIDVLQGTGILSTTVNPIWNITANDKISVPLWYATAVAQNKFASQYRELDVPVNYSHAIGQWTLGAGYQLYSYYNCQPAGYKPAGQGIQNEINENVAYTYTNSYGTLTPSITYYQELGTPYGYSYGAVNGGSSYLSPSLAATIPLTFIKKDGAVTFNPNTQYNFSFKYNAAQNPQPNGTTQFVNGANNWQFQLPVTWQVTKTWSVTGYWAYSYQGIGLYGTASQTGWAGASVGASF